MGRENLANRVESQENPAGDGSGGLVNEMHKRKEKLGKKDRKKLKSQQTASQRAETLAAREAQSEATKRGIVATKEIINAIPDTRQVSEKKGIFDDFSHKPSTTYFEDLDEGFDVRKSHLMPRREYTKAKPQDLYKLHPTELEERHTKEGTISYEQKTPFQKKQTLTSATSIDTTPDVNWQTDQNSSLDIHGDMGERAVQKEFKQSPINNPITALINRWNSWREKSMMKKSETAEEPDTKWNLDTKIAGEEEYKKQHQAEEMQGQAEAMSRTEFKGMVSAGKLESKAQKIEDRVTTEIEPGKYEKTANLNKLKQNLETINERLEELAPTITLIETGLFRRLKINKEGFIIGLTPDDQDKLLDKLIDQKNRAIEKNKGSEAQKLTEQIEALDEYQNLITKRDKLQVQYIK